MTKTKYHPLLSALACVAALALAPAQAKMAAVTCGDSEMIASSCDGPFKHSPKQGDTVSFGANDYAYFGASNSSHPFIDAPSGDDAGTLKFAQALYGPFLLGIRVGSMYSLYLFDGDGVISIDFDTWGVVEKGNGDPRDVTHAFLFTPGGVLPPRPAGGPTGEEGPTETPPHASTVQQVPEPASGVLAIVALGAAGLAARRRR